MEVVSQHQNSNEIKYNHPQTIRAADVMQTFDLVQEQIDILSLDCFDTLLWRKTVYPKDVFYDLQNSEIFKSLGITAMQRIDAESQTRRMKFTAIGSTEVNLYEIYHNGFPSLTTEAVDALVEAELAAEMRACYAYPKIVELMTQAHVKNKKIIVVSNTYLSQEQLRRLLKNSLPHDSYEMIDNVYCSSDVGRSKGDGMFAHVLTHLNIAANKIFHLGDNRSVDCLIPAAMGIKAYHLSQFDSDVIEWMRLHSIATTMTNTSIHDSKPYYNIYRGLFSTLRKPLTQPEEIIGYMSFGPIMYAFARFLQDEFQTLKIAGKKLKVLYLMRDAYLPYRAYETLTGDAFGRCVRVSRFSATAASFKTEKDVIRYLSSNGFPSRFHEICEQLMLTKEVADRIIQNAIASPAPVQKFNQLILDKSILKTIFDRSTTYRKNLMLYLKNEGDIKSGDSVILVDIGYIGRTQRVLTSVLHDELQVHEVLGRYLISMNIPEWRQSRKGLIDPSWCDDRVMCMLASNLSLFEEVCSSGDETVVNYTADGMPVFSHSQVSDAQRDKVKAIQLECLRFIRDAKVFFADPLIDDEFNIIKEMALYEIVRREYFPMAKEVHYFKSFRHEKNVSTTSGFTSFEGPENEYENLRRQGLCFVDQHSYGLRAAHMAYALSAMAHHRFGFEMNLDDISMKRELLTVIKMVNQQPVQQIFPAIPTDDGYYSLWFPIEKSGMQIAILFGLKYQYLQIDSAEVIAKQDFYQLSEKMFSENVMNHLLINQMINKGKNLYECQSKLGSVLYLPKIKSEATNEYFFRIVFRPVVTQL